MGFSCGIVGLPNVGKSTLFNALSSGKADAQNFPFCTIDPNVGIVAVPDRRFRAVADAVKPERTVPATIQFVDIAGLVRGASKGEGLGNQFLAHIREVDAVAHVVRCFTSGDVTHVEGRVDPLADLATIHTELCLKDLETVERRLERARKQSKGGDPIERMAIEVCERLSAHLNAGNRAKSFVLVERERPIVEELQLLTNKPIFYIGNIDETALGKEHQDPNFGVLDEHAKQEGSLAVPICAALEAQIVELEPEERPLYLESVGLEEPGLSRVIRAGYEMLGLVTFFTTTGKKECRAWTVPKGTKAPQAAGVIHTDFERGFIRAEVVRWDDFCELGSEAKCRDAGKLAVEGRDYVVRDGDVIHFRFNV